MTHNDVMTYIYMLAGVPMVIRYNFHIENFTRYPVTGAVDSDVLESSLYIMKACPVMYTGLRQLRLLPLQFVS